MIIRGDIVWVIQIKKILEKYDPQFSRIMLSPHEWMWTQLEQENMAKTLQDIMAIVYDECTVCKGSGIKPGDTYTPCPACNGRRKLGND
jgi:DnaJ-class molecular chaperone